MKTTLGDRPVTLSRRQFKTALEEGESFWLYIVEKAGSKEARLLAIQDPVGKARYFTFDEGWSVCVVLASAGYPETSRSGDRISGLDVADGCRVYHAGTRLNAKGEWETAGGRVLAVVCGAETRENAVKAAHLAADGIRFDGLQRRRDVGILHFGSDNS